MTKFLQKHGYLIILLALCIPALLFFTGHYSNLWLDVGREVFYPEEILAGKVLYKDLFNIYGPLAYLFNALLYKIFGANLNTLFIAGGICSLSIVTSVYLIAKRFLSKFLSFAIGFFVIATGICSTNLFNFTFPYSWAMLYGTVLSLYSLLFLIKFKDSENPKCLYLSAFFCGAAAAAKYDFILYSLIVLFFIFQTKNIKTILKSLAAFLFMPYISFQTLFLQGLNIQDIINTFNILNTMTHTKTLNYFYRHSGVYFSIPILGYWIVNLIKSTIGFGVIFSGFFLTKKNSELGVITIIVGIICAYFLTNPAIFAYLCGAIVICTICLYKKIKSVKLLPLLILSIIVLSLKSFWGLTPLNYGNYYCALVLVGFFAVFFTVVDKKYQKAAGIYILAVSLWFVMSNCHQLSSLNTEISKNHIYTTKEHGTVINNILEFLKTTDENSRVVIFPEGLFINFVSSKSGEDFYNSLLPLYAETFTENKLIEYFEKSMPDYIIFTNQNFEDYNSGYMCRDYATGFCRFVFENYRQIKTFGSEFGAVIFNVSK